MSKNLIIEPSAAVSPVGNAWIVCRSKSYAGRIYYFNTSTGETVWNLSEPEILKAKAMTKILKSQSGFQPDNCPEPVQPPEADANQGPSKRTEFKYHNTTPAKIYNKQVINNQFTNPYSNQLPNYNMSNAIELNIPVASTFNGLWNLAPQPIFVAPTLVPTHQDFTNFNQVPVTTTTVSLSNRFKNDLHHRSKIFKFGDCKKKFKSQFNNNNGPRKKYFKQKLQNKKKNVDLRLVISSRRSSFTNTGFQSSNLSGLDTFSTTRNANTCTKNTLRENNYNMVNDDDMWLKENLQSKGRTDKLDATPLKTYLQIENSHIWYIIADSNALLNNVNFLNILLNSDKHCRLIVPEIIMNIIKDATNSRLGTQAHRAKYFISQRIDENLATIVPYNEGVEESTDEKHCIITCCSKLMKQDFHVIILTDSIELNVLKETGELPILTISEIKKLLSKSQLNEIESIETRRAMESRNIKITIPNTKKVETNLISQTEDKTNQTEETVSETKVPENDINSSLASCQNTDLNKNCKVRLKQNQEFSKLIENDRNHCKLYGQRAKRIDSIDSPIKCDKICNSKNSNFESSSESIDKVDEDVSANSNKNEDISILNANTETESHKILKETSKETMEYNNVMFEVTSQAMENYLKMKSDEWISRFIQIMEEVLAQILQLEPKFVLESLPPPWTLYEATECIKRKFKSDNDILDAATKLLNVLFELGGIRGTIKNDPSPGKYMEMYSFGVYLIDALQGLLSTSEDLQTAAESLSKLLNDIQNPHLDPCNEDSFVDLHHDKEIRSQDDENCYENEINSCSCAFESVKPEESVNNIENPKNKNTASTPKRDKNITPGSPKMYNLRSNRKKKSHDKDDVLFIRNLDIESSFFSSLELRKNDDKGIFSKILSNDTQNSEENKDRTVTEMNSGDIKTPRFIRNISKCIEFEEKLKKKSEVPYDSWTHRNEDYKDYEEELDYESLEEGYCWYGEYNDNKDMYENHDNPDHNPEFSKYSDDVEANEDLPNNNNNVDFSSIVQKLQSNIKEAYSVVQEFCKKFISMENIKNESDILLAEKTYIYIENLCNTFHRILERESNKSNCKLQELFKNEEFEGIVIAKEDLENYRSFINNCLVQGNVLKESLRLIIDASKEVTLN